MSEKTPKILVVDDILKNIQILGNILTKNGYEIEFATNGEEALQWAFSEKFCLILLDIMMPGMDGYQVCKELKQKDETKDIPVIFLTAKTETDNIVKGFELGAVDYITKPFNKEELLVRVKNHVELQRSREELKAKNKELFKKNKHISDSVNYARRIQEAALPDTYFVNEILPEHFVIYKPKDVVSGDLYWLKQVKNKAVVAVGDCTGHGVPGAFMSMLGLSFLNEIIYDIGDYSPAMILEALRNKIKKILKRNYDQLQDSIDMSLAIIDHENYEMYFSGANAYTFIARQGDFPESEDEEAFKTYPMENTTIIQLKGNRQTVGFNKKEHEFKTQKIILKPNDMLYMLSDGYIDQLGGEKIKRFTRKRFLKIVDNVYNKPVDEQKEIFEKHFDEWKSTYTEQLDDNVILGFKVQESYGEVDLF